MCLAAVHGQLGPAAWALQERTIDSETVDTVCLDVFRDPSFKLRDDIGVFSVDIHQGEIVVTEPATLVRLYPLPKSDTRRRTIAQQM
jgi:hypothetical protein